MGFGVSEEVKPWMPFKEGEGLPLCLHLFLPGSRQLSRQGWQVTHFCRHHSGLSAPQEQHRVLQNSAYAAGLGSSVSSGLAPDPVPSVSCPKEALVGQVSDQIFLFLIGLISGFLLQELVG